MAAAGAKTVRQNFRDLDRMRHRGGSHHYYAGAARATTHEVRGFAAFIVVDHVGIRQRIEGGLIEAKPGSALTIPVKDSDAEGRRASEFDDLFAVNRGENRGFLARLDPAGEIEPLFWLRDSVYQYPDPSVLPTEGELMDSMTEALDREIRRT